MTTPSPLAIASEAKLRDFIRAVLKLGDDVEIEPDVSLIEQIGLDSIEAFDAVATLHELLGVSIPDDFDPKATATLRSLGQYLIDRFGTGVAQRLLELDVGEVARMRSADEV
jgi:acyl carrier protein